MLFIKNLTGTNWFFHTEIYCQTIRKNLSRLLPSSHFSFVFWHVWVMVFVGLLNLQLMYQRRYQDFLLIRGRNFIVMTTKFAFFIFWLERIPKSNSMYFLNFFLQFSPIIHLNFKGCVPNKNETQDKQCLLCNGRRG